MAELIVTGWFVSAAVSKVSDLIKFYIENQIEFQKDGGPKLHTLDQHLRKIQAAIFEVGKRQIMNPSLEGWLWDVKDAVYSAEDIIDGFDYRFLKERAHGEDEVSGFSSCAHRFGRHAVEFFKRLSFNSEEIKQLDEAIETCSRLVDEIIVFLKVVELNVATNKQHEVEIPSWRRTTSPIKSRPVGGRQYDKDKMLKLLLENDESGDKYSVEQGDELGDKYCVLAIVGPGGIGKTHLARLVYNNGEVQGRFNIMAWVCVCNNFDVKRLSIEIIESAATDRPGDLHSISNLDEIQKILSKKLMDKKFLIVLDDVWDESITNWENLRAPFSSAQKGSRIIVTTRNQNVAKMMGTKETIYVDGLEEEKYWELFKQRALRDQNHTDHQRLEPIGREIAQKLGGSPLAAVTIGRALESKLEEEHWRRILHRRICDVKQNEGDIVPVLRLSYDHLPAHLKQCYIACSLFPKNHCFEKDELLRIWMALGFVQGDDENNRMEDVGEELIDELSCRSFFVNAKRKENKFELHPVLHEFAECISDGEYFRLEGRIKSTEPIRIPNKARHIYVTADNLIEISDTLCKRKNIRSLVVAGKVSHDNKSVFDNSLKQVLKGLTCLRLLILSELGSGLPEAIGNLIHLRYLEIPGGEITEWPESFCKLYHLQWLSIKMHSKRFSLPNDMNRLSKLHCLHADKEAVSAIPLIGKLIFLQELMEYRIQERKGFDIGQLKHMNQLRRLCIQGLHLVADREKAAEAKLEDKEHLSWLELNWSNEGKQNMPPTRCKEALEGLQPHSSLRELTIKGYKGGKPPCWMENKHLFRLERIELCFCHQLKVLPPLGELPFLKVLHLRYMSLVEEVGTDLFGTTDAPFPSLEELLFDELNQWKRWNGVKEGCKVFPRLHRLIIRNCRSLTGPLVLPSFLKELAVQLFSASDTNFLLEDKASTSMLRLHINNLVLLPSCLHNRHLASLRRLEICGGHILRSFSHQLEQWFDHLTFLKQLSLINCDSLQHLPSKLSSLPNLESLHLINCPLIEGLPEEGLSSKLDLDIKGCPYLETHFSPLTTNHKRRRINPTTTDEEMSISTPQIHDKTRKSFEVQQQGFRSST